MFAAMLALVIASPVVAGEGVSISNFRSGLACRTPVDGSGPTGWICQPTELVLVTDQSTCNYDGEDIPCTWVGFEFDYVADRAGAKLSCVTSSSRPFNSGNPKGILAKDVSRSTFEFALPDQKGHFFNPQYYGIALQAREADDVLQHTACSSEGKELFSFKYRLHFPVAPASMKVDAR